MAKQTIETVLTLDNAKFKSNMSDSQKDLLKFTASVTALGIAAIGVAKLTANFQDQTIKSARAAGTTAESFSAMAHAADMSGVSVEELTKTYSKLNNITADQAKTFKQLGVALTDNQGNLKNSDKLLNGVADKIKSFKSPADQAAVAVRFFGEEGGKLVGMLKDGSAGLSAMRAEAEQLGLVVSTRAAEAAEKFNGDIARTTKTVQGLGMAIGESIIQFANQSGVMDYVREKVQAITKWWRGLSDETKNLIIKIGAVAVALATVLTVVSGLVAIAPMVGGAFTIMFGPVGLVVAALAALTAGVIMFWDQVKVSILPLTDLLKKFWDDLVKVFVSVRDTVLGFFDSFSEGAVEGVKNISVFGTIVNVIMKSMSSAAIVAITPFKIMFDIFIGLVEAVSSFGKAVAFVFAGEFQKAADSASAALGTLGKTAVKVKDDFVEAGIKLIETWKPDTILVMANETKKGLSGLKKEVIDTNKKTVQLGETIKYHVGFTHELVAAYREYLEVLKSVKANGGAAFKDIVVAIGKVAEAAANLGTSLNNALSQLMETFVSDIRYEAQIAFRDLDKLAMETKATYEKTRGDLEANENAKLRTIEDAYQNQIDALRYGENSKLAVLEAAANERLLLLDDEYAKAKAAAEAKFLADMERERADFETRKAFLLEKSDYQVQQQFVEVELDEDFKNFMEGRQREFEQSLTDLQKSYLDQRKEADGGYKAEIKANEEKNKAEIEALTLAKAAALEAAEADKNAKLKKLDEDRTAQEKEEEKRRLEIQYNADVQEFEQMKATKIAGTITSGIAAAAQAFAGLAAIPFVGIPLGIAAAATVLTATYRSVSQMANQQPVKPAGLLRDGGLIGGNTSHENGGLAANVESGEFVIDKVRTSQLYEMLDNQIGGGGGIVINFNAGAIVGSNMTNEQVAQMVAFNIATELRRQGIVN